MITFFKKGSITYYAIDSNHDLSDDEIQRLAWLLGGAEKTDSNSITGTFIGPRREMITPWSTNAVEITQNMGLAGINRIEEYMATTDEEPTYDKMLQRIYHTLDQDIFSITKEPEPIVYIENIEEYNQSEGLALNLEEIEYLKCLSKKLGRPLTDSEVFGFSQVNSEHCRHKIFNGKFVIDGEDMPTSLFKLIKKTSQENPNRLVSAYKDNVAFVEGPSVMQFAPRNPERPDFFETKDIETVISLKAETHNFPHRIGRRNTRPLRRRACKPSVGRHGCLHDILSSPRRRP